MLALKEVAHPGMRLGKHPARQDKRTLQLGRYLKDRLLPAAPTALELGSHVPAWGMMRNDELGDCAIATPGHLEMLWTSCASKEFVPGDAAIVKAYSAVSGYDPATGDDDNGCVVLDVLNYWRKTGIAKHKIAAYAAVDHRNVNQVRTAAYLFGGLYLGLALPLTAQSQRIWDVPKGGPKGHGAPGSWGGHAVPIVAYDAMTLTCITWGQRMQMTWAFFAAYCDECYAILSKDWIEKSGTCPEGFDLVTLQADLKALGS